METTGQVHPQLVLEPGVGSDGQEADVGVVRTDEAVVSFGNLGFWSSRMT